MEEVQKYSNMSLVSKKNKLSLKSAEYMGFCRCSGCTAPDASYLTSEMCMYSAVPYPSVKHSVFFGPFSFLPFFYVYLSKGLSSSSDSPDYFRYIGCAVSAICCFYAVLFVSVFTVTSPEISLVALAMISSLHSSFVFLVGCLVFSYLCVYFLLDWIYNVFLVKYSILAYILLSLSIGMSLYFRIVQSSLYNHSPCKIRSIDHNYYEYTVINCNSVRI